MAYKEESDRGLKGPDEKEGGKSGGKRSQTRPEIMRAAANRLKGASGGGHGPAAKKYPPKKYKAEDNAPVTYREASSGNLRRGPAWGMVPADTPVGGRSSGNTSKAQNRKVK